jgi:hypothetical protein
MSGTATAATEVPSPSPDGAAAPGFWAPEYAGLAHRDTPALQSAARSTTQGGVLVAAAAGALLVGATLMFVRQVRRRRRVE